MFRLNYRNTYVILSTKPTLPGRRCIPGLICLFRNQQGGNFVTKQCAKFLTMFKFERGLWQIENLGDIMKRIVSGMLSIAVVTGFATPVSGQVLERTRFMAALNATNARLESELEGIKTHYSEFFQAINGLLQQPHEIISSIEVSDTEGLLDFGFFLNGQGSQADGVSRVLMRLSGMEGAGVPDSAISIYSDNDIIAASNPLVSATYFFLNRDITPSQWAQADIAQAGLLDYNDIYNLIAAFQMDVDNLSDFDNFESFPEETSEAFRALTRRHVFGATFSSSGGFGVPSSAGNIVTERLTATMRTGAVQAYLRDIAQLVEQDSALKAWLASWMGGDEPMAETMLEELAEGIRLMADLFSGIVNLNLYVASNGLAVRQELDVELYGGEASFVVYLDLLGRNFLINEMGFGMVAEMDGERVSLTYTSIGNNVFADGILDSRTEINFDVSGVFSAQLELDQFLNVNQTSDNFTMDIALNVDMGEFGGQFSWAAQGGGSYFVDVYGNTIFSEIDLTSYLGDILPGAGMTSVNIRSLMRPIAPSSIAAPANAVNIAELSLEDDAELVGQLFDILILH